MTTLPKETEERIKQEAETMALVSHDLIDADSWESGATAEATRALPLLEALEQFIKHHESGILPHRLAYDFGKQAINNYKQQ